MTFLEEDKYFLQNQANEFIKRILNEFQDKWVYLRKDFTYKFENFISNQEKIHDKYLDVLMKCLDNNKKTEIFENLVFNDKYILGLEDNLIEF